MIYSVGYYLTLFIGNADGGGSRASTTRTSRNAWVSRETSPVMETLFRRAADVLNIDESLLKNSKNVEDMQVILTFFIVYISSL